MKTFAFLSLIALSPIAMALEAMPLPQVSLPMPSLTPTLQVYPAPVPTLAIVPVMAAPAPIRRR